MRKRTKYMIFFGVGGLFLSPFVFLITGGIVGGFFMLSDSYSPMSSTQNSIASFFMFFVAISFWLLMVWFGYQNGIDSENDSIENYKKKTHSVKKAVLLVVLTIIVTAIIFSLFSI